MRPLKVVCCEGRMGIRKTTDRQQQNLLSPSLCTSSNCSVVYSSNPSSPFLFTFAYLALLNRTLTISLEFRGIKQHHIAEVTWHRCQIKANKIYKPVLHWSERKFDKTPPSRQPSDLDDAGRQTAQCYCTLGSLFAYQQHKDTSNDSNSICW